jgi:uncharacterized protein YyaL (SSP411 family)
MRTIILLCLATFYFASTSFKPTEEMKWMNWNEGYKLAKKSKKILLVDCYTDWCGWCKVMDRNTYSNTDVQKKIYTDFVPVKLNPELNQTYSYDGKDYTGSQLLNLLSNNRISGYPTIIFVIPNGKSNSVELSVGYSDAPTFSKVLDDMKAKKK